MPPNSGVFGFGETVFATGGGQLLELAGEDARAWKRIELPAGEFRSGSDDDGPWFVGKSGRFWRLERGPRLVEAGGYGRSFRASVQALDGGRLAVSSARWLLSAVRVIDPQASSVVWKRAGALFPKALGDLLVLSSTRAGIETLLGVDALSGLDRWRWTVPEGEVAGVVARVDDLVWISISGLYLVGLDSASGAERARIAPGARCATSLPDALGRSHLLSTTRQHWRADLRTASLEPLPNAAEGPRGPSTPQPLLALDDGTLLTRDRLGHLHRLGAGLPQYLWSERNAMIMSVWPAGEGLAVVTASRAAPTSMLHLLSPADPPSGGFSQ
jgi:hypothetical protein